MKLERFKEKNNKKKFTIIFTVCCILLLAGVFLYTSFAVFTEEKQFNVINGTYQDPGDIYFAVYIDGEITNTFPSKDSGYTLDTERSSCTNGATITWDNTNWTAIVNLSNYSSGNMSRTKCTMYFKEMEFTDSVIACNDTAANCLMKNASKNTIELAYDETVDNNLRYIGANPNNYVSFNNELWRIIGVMNNIDDGTGQKESRLKIIRNEFIGSYLWDNKADGVGSSTSRYGSNDWSDSTLQVVLNSGAYWNRTSGQCPYGDRGVTKACDFTTSGLTTDAKNMIGNAVWNLGGASSFSNSTSTFYASERGAEVYSGRPTTWTGKVALMYPSDYGYATSGGNTGRDTCLSYSLSSWDGYSDCYSNNWMYVMDRQWLLSPQNQSSEGVFVIIGNGTVSGSSSGDSNFSSRVNPVVYLSSNVKITNGDGSESNPFTLSL